jgi:hypothetical protein
MACACDYVGHTRLHETRNNKAIRQRQQPTMIFRSFTSATMEASSGKACCRWGD